MILSVSSIDKISFFDFDKISDPAIYKSIPKKTKKIFQSVFDSAVTENMILKKQQLNT